MIPISTFRLPALLVIASLFFFACKNDPPASDEVSTEEAEPRTRERQGPIIPFEVHDQTGKPVQAYRVFESFAEGSSGSVFQFQHGYASIPFETGARYRIQAEGYQPLDFEFTALDSLKRATFYLHRVEQQSGSLAASGKILKRDLRPFNQVRVKAGEGQGMTDAEGAYAIGSQELNGTEAFPLQFEWKDQQGRDFRLSMLFRDLRPEALRVDLVLGADLTD